MLIEKYNQKGSEIIVSQTSEVPTINTINGNVIMRTISVAGERVVLQLTGAEAKCVAALVQMRAAQMNS